MELSVTLLSFSGVMVADLAIPNKVLWMTLDEVLCNHQHQTRFEDHWAMLQPWWETWYYSSTACYTSTVVSWRPLLLSCAFPYDEERMPCRLNPTRSSNSRVPRLVLWILGLAVLAAMLPVNWAFTTSISCLKWLFEGLTALSERSSFVSWLPLLMCLCLTVFRQWSLGMISTHHLSPI